MTLDDMLSARIPKAIRNGVILQLVRKLHIAYQSTACSITFDGRMAARIVEFGKARASARLHTPFKLSLLVIGGVDELCSAKPRSALTENNFLRFPVPD
jgi:hypothetical protein